MKKNKQDIPAEAEENLQDASIGTKEVTEDEGKDQEPTLEEQLEQACHERDEQKKETLRIFADSENLKKRLLREKEDFCKFSTSNIIESILPVMDNLELALQHGKNEKGCQNLIQGVEMTVNIFKETLKKHGLTIIGSADIGHPFNPAIHEAVAQTPDDSMDEGCVSQLLQTGYKLHERLLRPAKVVVSRKCAPEGK